MELRQFYQLSQAERVKIFDKIVAKALQDYNLTVLKFKYFAEYSNVLYEIESVENTKYMLKIANFGDHSREELSEGLLWLDSLHKISSLNATRPVLNMRNEFITEVNIPETPYLLICSVFTWINGRVIDPNEIDSNYAYKWGKLMATIHNLSSKIDYTQFTHLKEWNKVFYWDKEELFDEKFKVFFPASRKQLFQKAVVEVQKAINLLYSSKQNKIILHADLHNENIHLFENELYAFDFEDVMIGYPIQDISIALFYINDQKNYYSICKAFKEGYASVLKFPESYYGEVEVFYIGRLLMFANYVIKLEDESKEDVEKRLARYEIQLLDYINKRGIFNNLL